MLISLSLGLAVGLILALAGAGGGNLAVPLLVFGSQIGVASSAASGPLAWSIALPFSAVVALGMKLIDIAVPANQKLGLAHGL